jgi:hypothetical protein
MKYMENLKKESVLNICLEGWKKAAIQQISKERKIRPSTLAREIITKFLKEEAGFNAKIVVERNDVN